MKQFFHDLFDYNFYSNKQVIEICSGVDTVPENTIRFFSHILNAHHLWNKRVLNVESDYKVWEHHEVEKWGDIHYENQRTTFEIISNTDRLEFDQRIEYENSEGRAFSNDLKDILFHIINHSTHHRGQILLDLRQNKIEPKSLDYIFYKR